MLLGVVLSRAEYKLMVYNNKRKKCKNNKLVMAESKEEMLILEDWSSAIFCPRVHPGRG